MRKKILVDWLTCTVGTNCFLQDFAYPEKFNDLVNDEIFNAQYYTDDSILSAIKRFLGLPDCTEFCAKRGLYGYSTMYVCGGIRIAWGGCDTIMIDLSGEGCRLLESLVPGMDWLELIKRVQRQQRHNFSRMDIACDVMSGLKMSTLLWYALHGQYVSRWKSSPRIVQGREETIDFGCPSSRTMLRIYNKTLERRCKVDKNIAVPDGWVRLELQLRDDAVDSAVREWIRCSDVSAVYFGLMSNHLRFVKSRPTGETNLKRLEVMSWWREFLDNARPIKLAYTGGLEYNLQSLEKYLFQQAASSIKAWLVLQNWDADKLVQMVAHRQCNDKQEALIHTMMAVDNDGESKPTNTL